MQLLPSLLSELQAVCATFSDPRKGRGRAIQRSVLSPNCNTIQRSEAQRKVEDSAGGKSLNLCEATESSGGRLEVVRTSSFALRDNSRPASRGGQTLSVTACAVVFRFRNGERRQFLSRHPHLHQGASAEAEQSLPDQVEETAGAYRDPLYFAGAEPSRGRKGLPRTRRELESRPGGRSDAR